MERFYLKKDCPWLFKDAVQRTRLELFHLSKIKIL